MMDTAMKPIITILWTVLSGLWFFMQINISFFQQRHAIPLSQGLHLRLSQAPGVFKRGLQYVSDLLPLSNSMGDCIHRDSRSSDHGFACHDFWIYYDPFEKP